MFDEDITGGHVDELVSRLGGCKVALVGEFPLGLVSAVAHVADNTLVIGWAGRGRGAQPYGGMVAAQNRLSLMGLWKRINIVRASGMAVLPMLATRSFTHAILDPVEDEGDMYTLVWEAMRVASYVLVPRPNAAYLRDAVQWAAEQAGRPHSDTGLTMAVGPIHTVALALEGGL